jgi:DnaK suppressor protein
MALQDPTEIDRLRSRLEARRTELQAEADGLRSEEAGAMGKSPGGHPEDAGELGEQHTRNAVRNAELRRDTNELLDIAAALQRMDDGSYGECIDCGCDVPPARLQAQPAAARCIACQEKHERSTPAVPPAPLGDEPPGVRRAP